MASMLHKVNPLLGTENPFLFAFNYNKKRKFKRRHINELIKHIQYCAGVLELDFLGIEERKSKANYRWLVVHFGVGLATARVFINFQGRVSMDYPIGGRFTEGLRYTSSDCSIADAMWEWYKEENFEKS